MSTNSALNIRLIAIGIIILIILISLYKSHLKDKGISKRIWRNKLILEFVLPLLILLVLLMIEMFIIKREEYHINLNSRIDWNLVKDFFKDLLYELIPIGLTFILLYYYSIRAEWKKEKKISNDLWNKFYLLLQQRIQGNDIAIRALNINDFRLFFHPLGLRYFLEIAKFTFNTGGEKERIIVMDCKRYADICNLRLVNDSLKDNDRLNDDERTFYNICVLHKINNIDLYLVPKGELIQAIYGKKEVLTEARIKLHNDLHSNLRRNYFWILRYPFLISLFIILFLKFFIAPIVKFFNTVRLGFFNLLFKNNFYGYRYYLRTLDSIIINGNCYYTTESNNNLVLHERPKKYKELVDCIFDEFTHNGKASKYHVDSILEYIRKK